MSSLHLSTIGPETKGFLIKCYPLTDNAIDDMTDWPITQNAKCVISVESLLFVILGFEIHLD